MNIVDVSRVSDLIRFPDLHAQQVEELELNSREGIFIGNMHYMPYFLNFNMLVNPHVFVCGVTGSGKTYMIRSLALRMRCMLDSLVVIIDFTGEYKEFVDLIGEKEMRLEDLDDVLSSNYPGIAYVNLKSIGNERNKVKLADDVFIRIIERMRSNSERERKVFVIIDEAWKLLSGSKALQTILREGRKYGYGLIFSSQLIEDVDFAMLSNAATLFIFRLQNKQSLNRIAGNYGLKEEQISLIQNLEVGSCAVIQLNASGKRGFFLIKKVKGLQVNRVFRISLGDGMDFEISRQKFEDTMINVCSKEALAKIMHTAEAKGAIELADLTRLLICAGVRRRDVLSALRALGIGDREIADAFAIAVSSR
ncbi:MAG: ATP-binding protein [Candidatus Micrarchaeales archaeon]